jgi:plasmid stabilization system protein ParE
VVVRWSSRAEEEFEIVITSVSRYSTDYAASLRGRVVRSTARLADLPRMGRVVPEVGNDLFRELVVDNYRVLYRVQQDVVMVVGIVDARRDFHQWLADHPEAPSTDA